MSALRSGGGAGRVRHPIAAAFSRRETAMACTGVAFVMILAANSVSADGSESDAVSRDQMLADAVQIIDRCIASNSILATCKGSVMSECEAGAFPARGSAGGAACVRVEMDGWRVVLHRDHELLSDTSSEEMKRALETAQATWRASSEADCRYEAIPFGFGSTASGVWNYCMVGHSISRIERIRFLSDWLEARRDAGNSYP